MQIKGGDTKTLGKVFCAMLAVQVWHELKEQKPAQGETVLFSNGEAVASGYIMDTGAIVSTINAPLYWCKMIKPPEIVKDGKQKKGRRNKNKKRNS